MNNVTIQSSCGHTLLPGHTATLTAVIDSPQNYRFMWQKKNLKGELLDWVEYGQTIQITSDEVSEDITYIVSVIGGQDIITDSYNNILTDTTGNILTASFTLYTSEHDVYNAQENDEIVPYVQELTILLTTRGKHIYGKINNIDTQSISYKMNLNSANELSFTVHKEVDGIIEPLWDKIKDFRLVYVKELNEYYQIKISTNNGTDDITKTISATSLCEAELSQIYIRNTEINTEDDIARDDYVVTKFYSLTDKKASLLDRILSFAPHYKIGHVDDSLIELQRSFSIDNTSIYDFLTGDCSEQFNCLFQFNSVIRTINVYDLYTKCLNPECGYRGDFDEVCPKCGSKKISYFGEDTSIFINSKNLSDSITFETDNDSVKNCFKIEGGDDDINAAIRNVNPNGTDVIYYITDDQKEEMSDELVQKISSYDTLYNEKIDTYRTLNQNIYDAYDKILYYTSSMMPDTKHEDVTATTEANKLTVANLSPIGLQKVTTSTSVATVNTALKMLAKVFVKSGYVKVDVDTDNTNTFTYVGTDEQHNHYGTWYGRFKVTNYSNDEDIVYTDYLEIKVYDLYETYLDQKIKKNIVSNDKDGEDSLFDVLTIKSLDNFKEAIKLYCLNRLTSFKSALEGCVFTLVEADQAKEGADLYEGMYLSYLNKLKACEDEIDARQKTINEWQNQLDEYTTTRNEIQDSLNFEKYLGEDLYYEFIAYKREDTYNNENYISDGLNNEELLKKAEELIENAQKELYKSAMKQHTITCTLYNLFQMKEFAPIRSKFILGNWMRILVDDKVFRIGLSSYEVNYGGLENINVEFTDATVAYNTGISTQSIMDKAQQMATSYSYVSNQAKKGEEARNSISRLLDNGLNTAVTAIKNADSEDIVIDKNGLRARLYDDINDYYAPEQLGILHNMLVFTDDYWRTAKTALGQITYTLDNEEHSVYGLIADVLMSGLVISGHIYSANYSTVNTTGTHIDLENGSFSFAGDKIVYDSFSNDLCLKDITVKFVSDGKIDKTTLQDVITGVNTNYLKLHKLESETIVAINGRIDNLKSITITTENFYAKFSEIDIAKIKELYTDSAFIRSLTTAVSSTVTSTVDTEFVKNLIVGHATLNDLFTSNFTIGSDDGGSVLMNGSTMQFKDKDGNVYVQIGTDKTGGHSIIINDSNGTAIMNGSGITANAIADGLIVDQMVKKKDTSYNGISGDKLDIDSVITNINGSTTTIKSSQIYFDEDKQTLNTKLSTMQNTLSSEMKNEVAKNKTYTAKIESSNGTVLAETLNKNTTLTCTVKNANDIVNINGTNYRAVWTRRTASGGTQDSGYNIISTSVSVAYTDISTDYIYTCTIQKKENNQWQNIISADITIEKNIYEVLKTEYYTKEESPKAILTILGETEISTVNGKENSIISTIQTTHETVDTFEKVIEKNNTTINDFVNKSASVYQDYDEFKTTVKKTYATNTKVDELANGNNLLRNSDTLIFDEYSIGSKLIDASGNMLIDASGYILIA